MVPAYINVDAIKQTYAPYHTMFAFQVGYDNVMQGKDWIGHHYRDVQEQAYDRGVEAACKVKSQMQWIDANVGAN